MTKQKLVVIGNGMAGARTVEEILARGGEQFDITMFGNEPHGNYNRILLSSVLNGSQHVDDIFLHPLEWYRANGITLRAGVHVSKIDRESKQIFDDEGEALSYDKLIIATGSRPFVPPLQGLQTSEGAPKPGVFTFRTIDDCAKIAGYAAKCRRAAVLGGGLLGLEAARGLLSHGAQVHIVHLAAHLMEMQLDPQAGAILKTTMEKMGLDVHLQKSTTAILGDEMVTGLEFKDGEVLETDMVVISCGVRPNVELAKECDLKVERAIVVDDQMRSVDDGDIYVVGECAQHRGKVYGLVSPLWEQARVLAGHITGQDAGAVYNGSKLATKLKVMGVELASMGLTEPHEGDEVVQFAEPSRGVYKKIIIREGKLAGAMLLGDTSKATDLMQAFDRGTLLPEERMHLLFDLSEPAPANALLTMPDEAQVCNCNAVSKGTIRQCVLAGARSLQGVMDGTRAGTGCGSCKPLVREIIEWTAEGGIEDEAAPLATANADAVGDLLAHSAPAAPMDALSPLQLRRIADAADKLNALVKMAGDGRIDLVGVKIDDLAEMAGAAR